MASVDVYMSLLIPFVERTCYANVPCVHSFGGGGGGLWGDKFGFSVVQSGRTIMRLSSLYDSAV